MKRQNKATPPVPLAHLTKLAKHVESTASWEDLELEESERRRLREVATHMRDGIAASESPRQSAKLSPDNGVVALFAGPSTTGTTQAAAALANDLGLELYQVDLSRVVSKYIGETEKNLKRLFDAAEDRGVLLLFDEADALFGKRTEVKDSHDRYANIEVGYLLQRMESYRGLTVLATNTKSALDPALLRRLRFVIELPGSSDSQDDE